MPRLLLLTGLLVWFTASPALALPQFAVRSKMSCASCHVNPTGGGMRSEYGARNYSYLSLTWKEPSNSDGLDGISPKLGENFQFGVDFRSIYYSSDDPAVGNSFVTMEGTFYAAVSPVERATVYLAKGLRSDLEAFALLKELTWDSDLRVGRFIPSYGWKFADHNAYTRSYLGYGMGRGQEDGVEWGKSDFDWEFSAALTNGSPAIADGDRGKALISRGAFRREVAGSHLTLGGSWRYDQFDLGKGAATSAPLKQTFGPFWGVNRGRVAYLGEADWIVANGTAFVVTHNASLLLRKGLSLSGEYDFHDPDLDHKNGFDWRGRIGAEFYPTGYLELLPGFVWERVSGRERGVGELQLHLWF